MYLCVHLTARSIYFCVLYKIFQDGNNLVMKNPQSKKFGSNSDERESRFPTVFEDKNSIDLPQTRKKENEN